MSTDDQEFDVAGIDVPSSATHFGAPPLGTKVPRARPSAVADTAALFAEGITGLADFIPSSDPPPPRVEREIAGIVYSSAHGRLTCKRCGLTFERGNPADHICMPRALRESLLAVGEFDAEAPTAKERYEQLALLFMKLADKAP